MSDFSRAIADRYKITGELGSGAMGHVYRAVQLASNRPVAIKVLAEDLILDPKSLKRLKREAKALSVLNHSGIVCVYEFDTVSAKMPFLVMEFVPGRSLKEVITDRKLSYDETLNLMTQAAKALSHAHVKGIIHRDIKPANMLIDEERMELKIVDFGIARPSNNYTREQLTVQGEVFGSPLYMSPEQCQGSELDTRSDIYSLGCVMFECVAGRPNVPFRGSNAYETMTMHLNNPPPVLEEMLELGAYREISDIVAKALSKKPEDRFASMTEFASRLAVLRETVVRPKTDETTVQTAVAQAAQSVMKTGHSLQNMTAYNHKTQPQEQSHSQIDMEDDEDFAERREANSSQKDMKIPILLAVGAILVAAAFWAGFSVNSHNNEKPKETTVAPAPRPVVRGSDALHPPEDVKEEVPNQTESPDGASSENSPVGDPEVQEVNVDIDVQDEQKTKPGNKE